MIRMMRMTRRFNAVVLSILALAIWVSPASSQSQAASISGLVSDSSGIFIPGVTVTVTNADSKAVVKVITNGEGKFSFSGLQPGTYNVLASLTGFEQATAQKPLNSGESAQLNFTLTIKAPAFR